MQRLAVKEFLLENTTPKNFDDFSGIQQNVCRIAKGCVQQKQALKIALSTCKKFFERLQTKDMNETKISIRGDRLILHHSFKVYYSKDILLFQRSMNIRFNAIKEFKHFVIIKIF